MKWSRPIVTIKGIKVSIHWTFTVLLLWIAIIHLNLGHGPSHILFGFLYIGILDSENIAELLMTYGIS